MFLGRLLVKYLASKNAVACWFHCHTSLCGLERTGNMKLQSIWDLERLRDPVWNAFIQLTHVVDVATD